jgi:MFS transporter, DHA3 family, macrolide efflux protein
VSPRSARKGAGAVRGPDRSRRELGRDFWLYRLGQLVSIVGDSCTRLAMAWWILGDTGSASKMAAIVAPVTFVQIALIPLFGPIGDKFSRKWVAVLGDVWRSGTTLVLGIMVATGYFNLPVIIFVSVLHGVGTALFFSVSESIVPQIVSRENVEAALRQEQAIMPIGTILGGLVAGVAVSWMHPAGAFLIDAVTFLVAAAASASIRADTTAREAVSTCGRYTARTWFKELKEGVRVVVKIPLELGVAILAGLLNLAIAPIDISLAYFVREAQQQPPWMLGVLETSMSTGTIVGTMLLGALQHRMRRSDLIVIGIVSSAVAAIVLPRSSGVVAPAVVMLTFGVGVVIANIPLRTQTAIAMPDEYRSRAGSVRRFIAAIAAPAGIAVTGLLIEGLGLRTTLLLSGATVLALSFGLFLIPNYRTFFDASTEVTSQFYKKHYPGAFT